MVAGGGPTEVAISCVRPVVVGGDPTPSVTDAGGVVGGQVTSNFKKKNPPCPSVAGDGEWFGSDGGVIGHVMSNFEKKK